MIHNLQHSHLQRRQHIYIQIQTIMETPPNTGPHRLNYMHFRRGEGEQDPNKNELLSKFGPKYHFYKKDAMPVLAQRQNVNKIMSDMKKHVSYLENTKWMFENTGDMNPADHLSHQNL